MNRKKIFTIGETVLDILFKGSDPVAAKPGGSVLNSSVSLGRLGLPVELITEFGKDEVGIRIKNFLTDNKVNTNNSFIYGKGNTSLALAFLDEDENAHYSFYKNYPEKRLDVKLPVIKRDDIVLFGSFFAVSKEVRPQLIKFLTKARKAGAIIIYDPNIRNPHKGDLPTMVDYIQENIQFADIIRGSNEDFKTIFDTENADEIFEKISISGNKALVCTTGPSDVQFRSHRLSFSIGVPLVTPVSTVGAGDNFNAGIIYSLFKLKITQQELNALKKQEWHAILDGGITFGTIVCKSYDNYISNEFVEKLSGSTSHEQ